jgi:hypothetical protein
LRWVYCRAELCLPGMDRMINDFVNLTLFGVT